MGSLSEIEDKTIVTVKNENIGFKCTECTKIFESKKKLLDHSRIHLRKACPQCDKKMKYIKNLPGHIRICRGPQKVQSERKIFPCDICNYKALSQIRLDMHLKKHSIMPQKPVVMLRCTFCEFSNQYPSQIKRHEETCSDKTETLIWF